MPPEDGTRQSSPLPSKSTSSSLAEVLKTLTAGRPKSHPFTTHESNAVPSLPLEMEGRRGSRVTFGFENLHKSGASGNVDEASEPDIDAVLRNLNRQNTPEVAVEEAENVARSLHYFRAEQAMEIWNAGAYLVNESSPPEVRKAGSKLLEAISQRQDLSLQLKQVLFRSMSQWFPADVIPSSVNALIALTDHGRKLDFTDEPVLPLVASWIVPLYESVAETRSRLKKGREQRPNGVHADDAILGDLFQFAVDLITLQRHPPDMSDIEVLLKSIFEVCKSTSSSADIRNSLSVFEATISTLGIPEPCLDTLLDVLCSIHASVKSLAGPTSRVVRALVKSRQQPEVVELLYSFLLETGASKERNLNVTRGAVDIFGDLLRAHGQDAMPVISFDRLMDCLADATKKKDGRTDADILQVCLNALQGDFSDVTLQHEWKKFVTIILLCSRRIIDDLSGTVALSSTMKQTSPRGSTSHDVRSHICANLVRLITAVESLWQKLNANQRRDALNLYMEAHRYLTPAQCQLALDLCKTEQLCYPEHQTWDQWSWRLLKDFILVKEKPSAVRIQALNIFVELYRSDEFSQKFHEQAFLGGLLDSFTDENSATFLEALVTFLVDAACRSNTQEFTSLIDNLGQTMAGDRGRELRLSPVSTPDQPVFRPLMSKAELIEQQSLSSISVTGLIKLFLQSLECSSTNAAFVFDKLVHIARSPDHPADSRLVVLKLLFRLRCDSTGSIHVVRSTENEFLMGILCRTIENVTRPNLGEETPLADRTPRIEEGSITQSGRVSSKDLSSTPLYAPNTRSSIQARAVKWSPPTWLYAEATDLADDLPSSSSKHTFAYSGIDLVQEAGAQAPVALKIKLWTETIITLLQREKDWDVYSYLLAHLGPQLACRDLFRDAIPQIKLLRSVLCEQVKNESFLDPAVSAGAKKAEVAICLFDALTMLISYHPQFAKSEQDELVRTFMLGIGTWEGSSQGCIHALSVCCHEIPLSVTKSLTAILDKMSKVITRSQIAVHILEFLALLARLPEVYVNLRDEEIRTVFGICLRFLETSRERQYKAMDSPSRPISMTVRLGGSAKESTSSLSSDSAGLVIAEDLSRYVYALTYHVMVFWFLALKIQDRASHIAWITKRLIFNDENGKEVLEERSQVFIDMMQRTAFSDLGETIPFERFPPSDADGSVMKKSWIVGMSIITIETASVSGLTQITKRQASGTTYSSYQQRTAPALPHQIPANTGYHSLGEDLSARTAIFPHHVLLQMTTTAFPVPTTMQPLPLPDDDFTRRAISTFDRNNIVDGYKIGVIYIGEGQSQETEILANTHGSKDYEHFLSGLGTKVSLKDARFNTQGLHYARDGEFTYAWRDRVTEIVYHVATMMPTNLEADPRCVGKKSHIGNDFVNIIFNRSAHTFNFNTIPSQPNFVNIVITPVSRISAYIPAAAQSSDDVRIDYNQCFYVVKVISKSEFPELSAAAVPKVMSGRNLASFVRLIALNSSVFSLASSRGGEHVSSWQNRLREIRRLRDRAYAAYTASGEGTADGSGAGALAEVRRSTKPNLAQQDDGPPRAHLGLRVNFSTESTNAPIDKDLFHSLDFSRWNR